MIAALPIILTVLTRLEITLVARRQASSDDGLGGDPVYYNYYCISCYYNYQYLFYYYNYYKVPVETTEALNVFVLQHLILLPFK